MVDSNVLKCMDSSLNNLQQHFSVECRWFYLEFISCQFDCMQIVSKAQRLYLAWYLKQDIPSRRCRSRPRIIGKIPLTIPFNEGLRRLFGPSHTIVTRPSRFNLLICMTGGPYTPAAEHDAPCARQHVNHQ